MTPRRPGSRSRAAGRSTAAPASRAPHAEWPGACPPPRLGHATAPSIAAAAFLRPHCMATRPHRVEPIARTSQPTRNLSVLEARSRPMASTSVQPLHDTHFRVFPFRVPVVPFGDAFEELGNARVVETPPLRPPPVLRRQFPFLPVPFVQAARMDTACTVLAPASRGPLRVGPGRQSGRERIVTRDTRQPLHRLIGSRRRRVALIFLLKRDGRDGARVVSVRGHLVGGRFSRSRRRLRDDAARPRRTEVRRVLGLLGTTSSGP